MRGHLEDRVRRRVYDPLAGPLVRLAELRDDRRPRGGLVAQPATAGASRELVQERRREAVRIRAKRALEQHSADLPMPGGRVLPLRLGERDTVGDRKSVV